MFILTKRVFLIGDCLSKSDTEILNRIEKELRYTVRNAGPKAMTTIISDSKGKELAQTIIDRYPEFSAQKILIEKDFISSCSLLQIKDILKISDVLILVFGQPLNLVYDWLSAKEGILSQIAIARFLEINSLLTREPYFW